MKLVKMSLAAAVAVVGLSAASVSTSGYVQVRYENVDNDGVTSNAFKNETKVEIVAASDDGMSKVVVRATADETKNGSGESIADINSNWDKAYGEVTVMGATLKAGKFGIPGSFTDNRGDGASVGYSLGDAANVTVSHTVNGADLATAGTLTGVFAKGDLGFATYNFDLVMGSMIETGYAVQANVPVMDGLSVDVGYGSGAVKDADAATAMGAAVNYSMKDLSATVGFTTTGENGGYVAENGGFLFGDDLGIGGIAFKGQAEVTAILAKVGTKVSGIGLGAHYMMASNDDWEATNIDVQASKSLSSNVSGVLGYAMNTVDEVDSSKIRAQLKFTF